MKKGADEMPSSSLILYQTEDGQTRVQCRFEDESIWLTQALISELFQVSVPSVNEHLKDIYADGEVNGGATIRKFRIVRQEGSRQVVRELEHYSLPAILAVGYRVRSQRGTQFRQWATERLSEYLVKGFTMDDERLKNPPRSRTIDDRQLGEGRKTLRMRPFRAVNSYSTASLLKTFTIVVIAGRLHEASDLVLHDSVCWAEQLRIAAYGSAADGCRRGRRSPAGIAGVQ